jgi:glycerol-3-phosphate dehydrogenase (NAD(P)+)
MTPKDFWRNSKVGVIGGGSWGTVLANLVSKNTREVRVWLRDEDSVRAFNSTRSNQQYLPEMQLDERVRAYSSMDRIFEGGLNAVIWALPSSVCRENAKNFAHYFQGDELIFHATKGVEMGTMKRISEVLGEELPTRRIGVISGPNLAHEVAKNEPAATVIASAFAEVCEAGQILFMSDSFRIYRATDVIGVEWAGTLKNVLAIAAGALDAMKLGWNARAMLITRGLAEMVRFGVAMGADQSTFLGLAGVGDLLATCSSPLSRNYRVGIRLAQGEPLEKILKDLGSTAEGVRTTQSVWEFASKRNISMPITEGVYHLLRGGVSVQQVLHQLMTRPITHEWRIQP